MTSPSAATWRSATVGAVRSFAASASRPRCGLCAATIDTTHDHAVSPTLDLACVCRPCHLTLRNPSGRWLAVDAARPPRIVRGVAPPTPVGLAVVTQTADGPIVRYPAPGGLQVVDDDVAWLPLLDAAECEPLVESLVAVGGRLVDAPVLVVVPTDAALSLQGAIAGAWVGLDGGPEVEATVRSTVGRWLAEATA